MLEPGERDRGQPQGAAEDVKDEHGVVLEPPLGSHEAREEGPDCDQQDRVVGPVGDVVHHGQEQAPRQEEPRDQDHDRDRPVIMCVAETKISDRSTCSGFEFNWPVSSKLCSKSAPV